MRAAIEAPRVGTAIKRPSSLSFSLKFQLCRATRAASPDRLCATSERLPLGQRRCASAANFLQSSNDRAAISLLRLFVWRDSRAQISNTRAFCYISTHFTRASWPLRGRVRDRLQKLANWRGGRAVWAGSHALAGAARPPSLMRDMRRVRDTLDRTRERGPFFMAAHFHLSLRRAGDLVDRQKRLSAGAADGAALERLAPLESSGARFPPPPPAVSSGHKSRAREILPEVVRRLRRDSRKEPARDREIETRPSGISQAHKRNPDIALK